MIKIMSILIILILISGCIDTKTKIDSKKEYFSIEDNETITLYPDNTFTSIQENIGVSGVYKIENNKLILIIAPFGTVSEFHYFTDKLIDREGKTWQLM